MQVQEAIDHVNSRVFKPGWRFYATRAYRPGYIIVTAFITTFNSSVLENGQYTERRVLAPDTEIPVMAIHDPAHMDYLLLRFAAELDEHENREFLRPRDGGPALLHPHTDSGNFKWATLEKRVPR